MLNTQTRGKYPKVKHTGNGIPKNVRWKRKIDVNSSSKMCALCQYWKKRTGETWPQIISVRLHLWNGSFSSCLYYRSHNGLEPSLFQAGLWHENVSFRTLTPIATPQPNSELFYLMKSSRHNQVWRCYFRPLQVAHQERKLKKGSLTLCHIHCTWCHYYIWRRQVQQRGLFRLSVYWQIRDEFSRCVRVKKFISSVFKTLKQRLFLDLPWRESLIWKGVGGGCVHEFQCPDLFSSPFLNKSFGLSSTRKLLVYWGIITLFSVSMTDL